MSEDDHDDNGALAWVKARTGVIIGAVGLVAWMALVWFMFGDVL